jgi:hypothetical protein
MNKTDSGLVMINRKLWTALANDQLSRHRKFMGDYSKACVGCLEILMCEGPIGLGICSTLDQMQKDGIVSGPKKIPFHRLRRKMLPVSIDCLIAYGLMKKKAESSNSSGGRL